MNRDFKNALTFGDKITTQMAEYVASRYPNLIGAVEKLRSEQKNWQHDTATPCSQLKMLIEQEVRENGMQDWVKDELWWDNNVFKQTALWTGIDYMVSVAILAPLAGWFAFVVGILPAAFFYWLLDTTTN